MRLLLFTILVFGCSSSDDGGGGGSGGLDVSELKAIAGTCNRRTDVCTVFLNASFSDDSEELQDPYKLAIARATGAGAPSSCNATNSELTGVKGAASDTGSKSQTLTYRACVFNVDSKEYSSGATASVMLPSR